MQIRNRRVKKIAQTSTELIIGGIGSLSSVTSISTSMQCVQDPSCSVVVKNPEVYIVANFIAFGGAQFFFAFYSSTRLVDFIKKQPTYKAKGGKLALILLLVAFGDIQPIFFGIGTNSGLLQTALSTLGSTAGSLFFSVNLLDNPSSILETFTHLKNLMRFTIPRCYREFSDDENKFIQQYHQSHQEHTLFQETIKNSWLNILLHLKNHTLSIDRQFPIKDFILQFRTAAYHERNHVTYLRWLAKAVGIAIGANFSQPLIYNAYKLSGDYLVRNMFFQGISTVLIMGMTTANILQLTTSAMTAFFDAAYAYQAGKPFNWLTFQINPGLSIASACLDMVISSLAYAPLNILYRNNPITTEGTAGDAFNYLNIACAIAVNFIGSRFLYNEIFSRLTSKDNQYLFEVERVILFFSNVEYSQFIKLRSDSTTQAFVESILACNEVDLPDVSSDNIEIPVTSVPTAPSLYTQLTQTTISLFRSASFALAPAATAVPTLEMSASPRL